MFKGENDAGFGDFENGFSPTDNPLEVDNDTLEGCQVEDDLNHDSPILPRNGVLPTSNRSSSEF